MLTMAATEIGPKWFFPDGWDLYEINEAVWSASLTGRGAAQPTSALLDGSALERRRRREAKRALDAVVRWLPVRQASALAEGEAA